MVEIVAVAVMLVAGGAAGVIAASLVGRRLERIEKARRSSAEASDEAIVEAILQYVAECGMAVSPAHPIDLTSWAARYAEHVTPAKRERLLEEAVKRVADGARRVPLRQYCALLDLAFGLGYQTDALARLRERYVLTYDDHAAASRPREADRAGGAVSFFARDRRSTAELLGVLGLEGEPTRQEIISAYRRLAALHHPDRFFGAPAGEQERAAARFIEIAGAYEALLLATRGD